MAELKAAEHHDAWLRAKADSEKHPPSGPGRSLQGIQVCRRKFAQAMLPVKDSLEAALATENASIENLREGVELTLKQLVSAFDAAKVSEENPAGPEVRPEQASGDQRRRGRRRAQHRHHGAAKGLSAQRARHPPLRWLSFPRPRALETRPPHP